MSEANMTTVVLDCGEDDQLSDKTSNCSITGDSSDSPWQFVDADDGILFPCNNTSFKASDYDCSEPQFERIYLFLLLIMFCILTVVGNVLVMVAVLKESTLHTPTNYFIASLAVADCLVGLIVMPFSATEEAMGKRWVFGRDWCDLWRSLDVLASTASILNLCMISLDRYLAITNPVTYPNRMTDKMATGLLLVVWVCSSLISFPAIAYWRQVATRAPGPWECPFTDDTAYLIFSSTVSFYGPLVVMVFTYLQVYRTAVRFTRDMESGGRTVKGCKENIRIHRGRSLAAVNTAAAAAATTAVNATDHQLMRNGYLRNGRCSGNFFTRNVKKMFAKEKKAAKTLGMVMGVFIVCWLPFFVTNIVSGLYPNCVPDTLAAVVTWLGWINSGMNPAIYACFSRDFRR